MSVQYAAESGNEDSPFIPSKLVILSELSVKDKERYYDMLMADSIYFRRNFNETAGVLNYIAELRLLAPNVKKMERKKTTNSSLLPLDERLQRLEEDGCVSVRFENVQDFDYNTYTRFAALIANNGDIIRPKKRPLQWVMKVIEDIYDARYAFEKIDIEKDNEKMNSDLTKTSFTLKGTGANIYTTIFPIFVIRRLSTHQGLKKIVDATCWDLLYNVHLYRRDYLEVEIFARFLQEFYNEDDLLFCLYVRSVVSSLLNISYKVRWAKLEAPSRQPKALWMSHREAAFVARTIFGNENGDMCRDFMGIITPQMVGQKTDKIDSRRIDVTQFLHLAVVGYHQTQEQNGGGGSEVAPGFTSRPSSSSIGGPVPIVLPRQVMPTVPEPSPSGGLYMSRYKPSQYEMDESFVEEGKAVIPDFNNNNYESTIEDAYRDEREEYGQDEGGEYDGLDDLDGLNGLSYDPDSEEQAFEVAYKQSHPHGDFSYMNSSMTEGGDTNIDLRAVVDGLIDQDVEYGASFDTILAAMQKEKELQGSSNVPEVNTSSLSPQSLLLPALSLEDAGENNVLGAIIKSASKSNSHNTNTHVHTRLLPPPANHVIRSWLDESGQWQDEFDNEHEHDDNNNELDDNEKYFVGNIADEVSATVATVPPVVPPRTHSNSTALSDYLRREAEAEAVKENEGEQEISSEIKQQQQQQQQQEQDEYEEKEEENVKGRDDKEYEGGDRSNVQEEQEQEGEGEDEYMMLQIGREQEFLNFLCEPLVGIDEEAMAQVGSELAKELRNYVNQELDGFEVTSIDAFDDVLLDILRSEPLRVGLEALRDNILGEFGFTSS